jgi:hypothetical protein
MRVFSGRFALASNSASNSGFKLLAGSTVSMPLLYVSTSPVLRLLFSAGVSFYERRSVFRLSSAQPYG